MEANGGLHLGTRSGESPRARGLAKVEKMLSREEEAEVVEPWIKEKMMAVEDVAGMAKGLAGKLEKEVLQLQKEQGEHTRTEEERWKAREANSRGLLS